MPLRNPKVFHALEPPLGDLLSSAHLEKKAARTVTPEHDAITGEAPKRYAQALFDLADDAGALDATERDMDALGEAFAESADLRRALASPTIPGDQKAAALNAVAKAMGLSRLSANFVGVAARNGRGADLPGVIAAFKRLAAKRRGATSADVASADALSDTQLKELKTALKTALGRDVEIRTQVRPELIGGLTVKVGSRLFDSSLRAKLERMRNAMKEA